MRLVASLALLALLGGCAHGLQGKRVADKRMPHRLIAVDGSECLVSESRFEKTEIGMRVLCWWAGGVQPVSTPTR
jgi:hypothetical protein